MQTGIQHFLTNLPAPYRYADYWVRPAGFMMDAHSHDFMQVIFVTSGTLTVSCGAESFRLTEGFVHVLPAGFSHGLASAEGYSQCGIDVFCTDTHYDISAILADSFRQPAVIGAPELLKFTNLITGHIQNADLLSTNIVKSSIDLILFGLAELQNRSGALPFSDRLSGYLDAHLCENLTLGEIAGDFYMSGSHLERLCKRYFGIGVKALQNRKRFKAASGYLVTTEKQVCEIASLTGFDEVSNFSAFFKRNSGMSPLAYRSEYKLR